MSADDEDPEMDAAALEARQSFRYFWREIAWERRRIIPALDLTAVKATFTDPDADEPKFEHMWVGEIDFDGRYVTGTLMNSPNWLTNVREGDAVKRQVKELMDWLYVIRGKAYGGFTISLIRKRMSAAERRAHDAAWGLDFGTPGKPRVVAAPERKTGLLGRLIGGASAEPDPEAEHPMSAGMAEKLKEHLAAHPEFATEKDDRGWTTLHHQALAGSAATVKVLLEHGADPNVKTPAGDTAVALARRLGWHQVVALLTE